MNTKQLKSFVTIAEEGSFSKASDKLFLSVPALKKQIDLLEEEVRVQLLVRTYRGVSLTEAGTHFYHFSQKTLVELNKELDIIRLSSQGRAERVRICYNTVHVSDGGIYYDALMSYRKLNPNVEVTLTKTDGFDVQNYDLFIGLLKDNSKFIDHHLLCQLPVNCIVSANSPLFEKNILTVNDLRGSDLFLPPSELLAQVPNLAKDLECAHIQSLDFDLTESDHSSYILTTIANNKCSILIGWMTESVSGIRCIPLEGYSFSYYIYSYEIGWNPVASDYIIFLQKYYAEHTPLLNNEILH